jgi:MFS family permease
MPARRHSALALLMVAQFFYAWGWATSDVLRPQIREALNLTLSQAGAGYSAQVIGTVIGAWLMTALARRAGTAAAMAAMMAGCGLSVLMIAFVTSLAPFLAARFVYGLFAGGIFPVTVAVYFALYPPETRGRVAGMIDACFYAAVIAMGMALARVAPDDWRLILWIGSVPGIALAPLAFLVIPAEARDTGGPVPMSGGLLRPDVRAKTFTLVALMGANAFGYQCFIGWLTTFLRDVRQFDVEGVGTVVATLYTVNAAATFLWGWVVDHYGRRIGAFGPMLCATSIALVIVSDLPPELTGMLAAIYGLGFAATVCLGPWIAEMFPPELRLSATSLFQWGRLVSLLTPLLTGVLAEVAGLVTAMSLGIAAFLLSTLIWFALPETLTRARTV